MTESRGRRRVMVVVGTRPEAVKLAPVVLAGRAAGWDVQVVATGQQRVGLVEEMLGVWGVGVDRRLAVGWTGESVDGVVCPMLRQLAVKVALWEPDLVVVQGDTSSALAGALAGFWAEVPVVHVEAGLRSGDLGSPFPEEGHRRAIGAVATWQAVPCEAAGRTVLRGDAHARVRVVGQTGLDALRLVRAQPVERPAAAEAWLEAPAGRRVLVTWHRRESWGDPLVGLCRAAKGLADTHGAAILLPVHPNPRVGDVVRGELAGVAGVTLVEPLGYRAFVACMAAARVIVTDSGGVQEEAPSLGVPVVVTRETTERPEVLAVGAGLLVGRDPDRVTATVHRLLTDPGAWVAMTGKPNPYGDGYAADRLVEWIEEDG